MRNTDLIASAEPCAGGMNEVGAPDCTALECAVARPMLVPAASAQAFPSFVRAFVLTAAAVPPKPDETTGSWKPSSL